MEQNVEGAKLEITLKLEPLGEAENILTIDGKNGDNWLENDNVELIGQEQDVAKQKDLGATISGLMQTNSDSRVIKCNSLQIKSTIQGYALLIEQDEILLQNGDIISLPGINLKTSIIQEHMVPVETSKQHTVQVPDSTDDIWSNNDLNITTPNFANPFISNTEDPFAQRSTQSLVEDPLDFLYDTQQRTAPILEQPGYNTQQSGALNINTNENYALLSSPGAVASQPAPIVQSTPRREENPDTKSEGNVLHELGINEAGSTIVNKQYTGGKSSFLDQSPMDMLDEYLDFDEDDNVNHTYSYPQNFQVMPNAQKTGLQSINNLAKKAKKAVKAFTEDE